VWLLDLEVSGPVGVLIVVAVADAVLGTALGLLVSAFANTEFQAVQFMPLVVIPQILLCGLFVPIDDMPDVLAAVAEVLPLTYAVEAMQLVASAAPTWTEVQGDVVGNLVVIAGFALASLALGAATLRRRTA
jgi:ABC-2 type transport system permease protein